MTVRRPPPPQSPLRPATVRTISIRWSLFRNIVLLLLLISTALLTTSLLTARRAVQELSRSLIRRTADLAEAQLETFFNPTHGIVQIAAEWTAAGLLDYQDPQGINNIFMPFLRRFPQISSLAGGDARGNNFSLSRDGTNWVNRIRIIGKLNDQTRVLRWTDSLAPLDERLESIPFDPRTRPWYQGALDLVLPSPHTPGHSPESHPVYWTQPYAFFTSQEPGITVSVAVELPDHSGPIVLALDVLLRDISQFTMSLAPSDHGFACILSAQDTVLGLPKGAGISTDIAADNLPLLKHVFSVPAAAAGHQRWVAEGREANRPVRFHMNNEVWWAGFRPFPLGNQHKVWIGVMVPQNDFMGDMDRQRNQTLLILASSLVGALAMVMLLSRSYSTPLKALVRQSQRIETLDLDHPITVTSRLREVAQLGQAQERMRGALESFARYVPTDVVRELVERGEAARIGGRTETLTVLFSDIRGFTALAESMDPEALMHELEDYFNAIQEVLDTHHATLDKFIGDAVLAFWGAPNPNPNHARDAVHAALQCQARLAEFNAAALTQGRPALFTTFGLASGPVVVGNMGASRRLNYSVIGHPVNLASRLQGLNRFYDTDILTDKAVRDAASPDILWRRVDQVVVKGGTGPVEIFEPLGHRDDIPMDRLIFKRVYEAALEACHNREFSSAMDLLATTPAAYATNLSVTTLTQRCKDFILDPPPENWDTSFRFKDK